MGIYRQATTVIGYEISTEKFFVEITTANCDHNPSGGKHCPECGRPVKLIKRSHCIDEWDDFCENFIYNAKRPFVSEFLYDNSHEKFYFGYGATADDDESVLIQPVDYDEVKEAISVALKQYIDSGLIELDDDKFGIWTIFTGH